MKLSGKNVIISGLQSAKDKSGSEQVAAIEAVLVQSGAKVVATMVQRRGVSRGGVDKMDQPLHPQFVMSAGKVQEVAAACVTRSVDIVVFVNRLDGNQRKALADQLGCAVGDQADIGM